MEHHAVGDAQVGAEEAEREARVEEDQVDLVSLTVARTAASGRRGEEEDGAGHPFDGDAALGLLGVELCGAGVRRRRQHHVRRVETTPQLPEVALDPAHLGREVVGDQEVTLHDVATGVVGAARAVHPVRLSRRGC